MKITELQLLIPGWNIFYMIREEAKFHRERERVENKFRERENLLSRLKSELDYAKRKAH